MPRAALGAALLVLGLVACSATPSGDVSRPTTDEPVVAPGLPEWQSRDGLAVPRDDFVTAVVGEEIWVLGGMTGDRGNRLDSVEVFDTGTGSWRLSDVVMPEGLASFEGVAIDQRVFVFGGLDKGSRPNDFAAVLDTATGRWRRLPPLPIPRYAHTVTLHDGLIYVIGGEGPQGVVETVHVFDPETERWTTGTPMPHPRGSHDTVSTPAGIYVLGGWLDAGPTDLVQTYDPTTGEWAEAAPLPEPVSRAGATALDGRLWVSYHDFSAVLALDEGTWSVANPLTQSRHGLGYVAVGGSIYGIGGCMESPLRDVRTVDVLEVT